MARVTVRMFATVREAAGESSAEVEASDLADLLSVIGVRFGPKLSKLLDEADSDPDRIVILINGRNPGRARTLSQKLSDGDEVAIFPPVSGG